MSTKKSPSQRLEKEQQELSAPWISLRSGLIIITITSLAMAILTAWQVIPQRGWVEGLLWGLFFGALVWAIFLGNLLLNKFLRRKR